MIYSIPEDQVESFINTDSSFCVGVFNKCRKFALINEGKEDMVVCIRQGQGEFINALFSAFDRLGIQDHPDEAFKNYLFDNNDFDRHYYLDYFKSLTNQQLKDWILAINFTGRRINTCARFRF